MIEFTKPMERVRRITQFARSEGDYQWNIFEASVYGWTDSWMVIPVPGGDVAIVEGLFYPSWLSHMSRGFCKRPSDRRPQPEGAYIRQSEETDVRLFLDRDSLAGELDWEPSEDILSSGGAWLAAYCPAGRIVLAPWAFGFTKPEEQRGKNSIWLPMNEAADDLRMYYQDGVEHQPQSSEKPPREGHEKSQYQACVVTETRMLGGIINPNENYHSWKPSKDERTARWLNLN